jgi:hypothetical protein
LENFLNEEVEDIIRGIELLNTNNLLLGKSNQIMESILISFEPNSFCNLFYIVSVVDCADFLDM